MPHYELLFPSLYIKAADLQGRDVTLTIRKIVVEGLNRAGTSKKEDRPIVYFEETAAKAKRTGKDEKRMVMNKTNARAIASHYGVDTDDWIGKKITLYPTRVPYKKETVEAIRVRTREDDQPPPPPDPEGGLVDEPESQPENAPPTTRPTYDLNAKCSTCGSGYSEGRPVNVATGNCDGCDSGSETANEEAIAAIKLNDADVR